MIYDNNEITAITYSGYNIVRAYSCGGELVFGNEPTPPGNEKIHMYFNDGGNDIVLECNSSSIITNDEVLRGEIEAGRTTYSGVTHVEFGNCVTEIEHSLLAWTAQSQSVETLTSVTIPDSVTTIGYSFCQGRKALTDIEYPSGVTVIAASSFEHCESLYDFEIKEGVTTIGVQAFDECKSLYDIVIPSTVTSIGQSAFHISNGTATINNNRSVTILAATPPTLGLNAFSFSHMEATYPIYVPAQSLNAYKTAPEWNGYANRLFAIA